LQSIKINKKKKKRGISKMEWQQEVKQIYEDMVLRIPEMVRPIIKPELFKAAEQKCEERNGKRVAEIDLVVAMFEVTPPAFQPTMIEDLKALGVDYDIYMPKVNSDFKLENDLNQLVNDIFKLGEITGVKCNREAIWKTLNSYKDFFSGSSISIRTTTKPIAERDISARYVEMMIPHNPDPYKTAISKGLIKKNGHPIHKMILEALDTFNIMGYGVDLDSRFGLSKIWPFIVPGSIDPLFSMKYIPKSMKKYEKYFNKHGLTIFSLFAFDFFKNTTNIYFMLKDPSKNVIANCKALVEDLGFTLASEEIMEKCCDAAHLNYTFSWDSEKIERICFGITCHDKKEVPAHFHPLIKEFVENSPFQSEIHKFIYGVTFTPKGFYYKIENDYNGTMVDFLLMGSRAGIDSYK